jgi:hypothetical protein
MVRISNYYTITACQQGKVEQAYIKSKCGHSILLDSKFPGHNNISMLGNSNLLDICLVMD